MKLLRFNTIGSRILVPTVALTVVLLGTMGIFMAVSQQNSIHSVIDSKGEALAGLLAKIGAPYIDNYDYPSLDLFVQDTTKDPEVAFAVFTDEKGKLLTKSSQEPADSTNLFVYDRQVTGSNGKVIGKLRLGYSQEILQSLRKQNIVRTTAYIFAASALMIAGLLLMMSRFVTRPMRRIIVGFSTGAQQVASASGQVSSVSRQLAEGASSQAASLEETSSSLEEMTSMIRQNATNATQANGLMDHAREVVAKANASMHRLTGSMGEISQASGETQKIVKTIDEIAFQTNLLALNAAVEAARAGEAGAGFAVVADEVRNLAIRAADAARNTADLIEGTVRRVKEGSELVVATNQEFQQVARSVAKSGELVGEIAAASSEQAQGIEQISQAISAMDQVTQQNTAIAEESAAASEEMNGQAEQMKRHVQNLAVLVGAKGDQRKRTEEEAQPGETHGDHRGNRPSAFPGVRARGVTKPLTLERGAGRSSGKPAAPKLLMPSEGEDLSEF